jgi:predicted kinase
MPNLVVMCGLPGTGKSYAVSAALEKNADNDVFVYSTDHFIQTWADFYKKSYDEMFGSLIDDAQKTMDSLLTHHIFNKNPIIWDQTNLSKKKRRSILSRFSSEYTKHAWAICPPETDEDVAEWRSRLSARSGKTIPDNIMDNMRKSYVLPEGNEGFDYVTYINMYGKIVKQTAY